MNFDERGWASEPRFLRPAAAAYFGFCSLFLSLDLQPVLLSAAGVRWRPALRAQLLSLTSLKAMGVLGLWQLFPLLSALVKVRHVRPPSCCMKRFRFAYRERLFTVSACRSRREAASFAVSALGCRPSMVEAAFSFGQVRAIVESFDLVYCDPAPSVSTTILLQRRYGTGTVALRVPVCMTIVSCAALYQSRQTCEFACFAPAQP